MEDASGCSRWPEQEAAPSRLNRVLHRLPAVLGLVLMIAAFVVIQRELRTLSMADIRNALRAVPDSAILKGIGCTVLSYGILSFYDRLACIQVGARQPFRRTAFAAFCSYVLSHNLGCSAISGAAVRFRLYRNWGVESGAIAQIIAFCSMTYLLGTLWLVGGILLLEPGAVPGLSRLPHVLLMVVGAAMWAAVFAYTGFSLRRRHVTVWKWRIELPKPRMAFAQTAVAGADMAATALIAYVLLPAHVPIGFPAFLAIYLMSYTAGLVASVPGGLGVFDSAMMLALGPYMSAPQILSTVLVFRLLYYIIPLVMAGLMFAGHEMFLRGDAALSRRRALHAAERGEVETSAWPVRPSLVIRESEADFSVGVATGVVAATGILLVGFAVLPFAAAPTGFGGWWLREVSDALLTVDGIMLVGFAVGLSQRVLLAWRAVLVLLCVAIGLVFARHAPIGVPVSLALVVLLLAPFRSCYYRHAKLLSEPLSPTMLMPVSLWILSLCGVAVFAVERHLGVSWWRELLHGAYAGKARWVVGGSAVLCLLAIVQMIRVGRAPVLPWTKDNAERYYDLDHALAEFGPRPPNGVLFGEAGRAAIPFLRTTRFIIGLGDPAGQAKFCVTAIWRLRDLALQEGRHLVFIRIGETMQTVYCDLGLSVCRNGPGDAGTLCCLPQDETAVRAVLAAEYRRFVKKSQNAAASAAASAASALLGRRDARSDVMR